MAYETPLVPGRLIKRYKRFLADIRLDSGTEVTAHCPNPGAMLGLSAPGTKVWLEPNTDPRKKLRWGWRLVELPGGHFVGIDTGAANRIVGAALRAGQVAGLRGDLRAEVPCGPGHRVDFVLDQSCFVEVKSVTLRRDGWAEFPDTVTARGTKHLNLLADLARQGQRAVLLYLVQRTDCDRFRLASDLDPAYAAAATKARQSGVEMLCYGTRITPLDSEMGAQIEIDPRPQI